MVYDSRFEAEARQLAQQFFLDAVPLATLAPDALQRASNAIVYIDLGDINAVIAFRGTRRAARRRAPRCWVFIVASGADGANQHAWRVQADALGATGHVSRSHAPRFLGELFSIARRMPLSAARAAELRKSAGGASIHNAGKELLRLFDDMAAGRAGTVGNSVAVGREINKSVGAVGVGEWLTTVRTYHDGTFQHCLLVTGVVGGSSSATSPIQAVAARLTTAASPP